MHAIVRLAIPLKNGARNAYYTDIIGNVSTSRFRPARGVADAHLEIQPRYPIFGGWNYTFRLGWNVDLDKVERTSGAERVLKIPFLEGPENIQYGSFDLTVILPEGSRFVPISPCPFVVTNFLQECPCVHPATSPFGGTIFIPYFLGFIRTHGCEIAF
jgi:oligosaccharyltransferase complex subunit alpha (ribophorin I)